LAASRIYRLGSLHTASREARHQVALLDELRQLGFVEGQNLMVDWKGYGLSAERFEQHAAELVNSGVDVIVAGEMQQLRRTAATSSIPILALTDDMVGQGFVRSLAKPSGNTTGVTILASERKVRCCRNTGSDLLAVSLTTVDRTRTFVGGDLSGRHILRAPASFRDAAKPLEIAMQDQTAAAWDNTLSVTIPR
jgi:ABC transporter substrate binding protein